MIIRVMADQKWGNNKFDGDYYEIDLNRPFGGYEEGDIICNCCPFGVDMQTLKLEFAIRLDGSLIFRAWSWSGNGNPYVHTTSKPDSVTQAQLDTVAGLFSGRITFDGLRLSPGKSLQEICPIDLDAEQKRLGKTIYLNRVGGK